MGDFSLHFLLSFSSAHAPRLTCGICYSCLLLYVNWGDSSSQMVVLFYKGTCSRMNQIYFFFHLCLKLNHQSAWFMEVYSQLPGLSAWGVATLQDYISIFIPCLWQKKCVYAKLKFSFPFVVWVFFFPLVESKRLITLAEILALQLWVWDWFTESNVLDKLFGGSVRPIYNQLLQTVETSASHPLPFIHP